jgi:hypothetical protein
MNQRLWTLVLVAVLALATLVLTTGVLAKANSTGVTVPYASRLTDDTGQPLNGTYAFTFALYDAPTAGQLLWAETRSAVAVQNGDFALGLGEVQPIPKAVAERKELWLAVSVRGPQEATFTLLTPRQKFSVTGGGGSTLTCPHSHFNDSWSGSNYGSNGLAVTNAGGGDGIDAYSYATRTNWAAVYAYNLAGSGDGTGMYGGSYYGSGVQAYSQYNDGLEATSDTTWASAIYAHSAQGNGIWAVSGNRIGVYATTANTTTNVAALEAYNSGTPSGGYGGKITSKNYRGGFIGTLNYIWYGAVIDGGLSVTNGNCTGCTLVYVGQNHGDEAVRPGDLVAIAGVATDAATNQPVMQVRLAQSASDPVIGVAVSGTSAPGTGPDKIQSSQIMPGEYLQIAVSGLVQARMATKSVAIGDRLSPSAAGAVVAAANTGDSVARVLSAPDGNGLVWVIVAGR